MSNNETHRGRIIPILREDNENFSEYVERATGIEFLSVEGEETDDILEFIDHNNLYDKFFFYDEKLYKIDDEEFEDDDDYVKHKVLEDGVIEYSCRFYNGGTCLSEVIEEILQETK